MIVGVAFFSFLTATFSSWFMRDIETEEKEILERINSMEKTTNEMKSQMDNICPEMLTEINELKEIIKKSK
jgi:hypothetical protein